MNHITVTVKQDGLQILTLGTQGATGASGKSAYQTALDNGFIGTEPEWLVSLTSTGGNYQHTQSVPSDTWAVNHNLNRHPNITLTSVGGKLMIADILHTSINQVLVYFDQPTTGLAICS